MASGKAVMSPGVRNARARARVAIVCHAALPQDPRISKQAETLVEAGYEVDIFALREPGQPREESIERLRILRLPVRRRWHGMAGHMAEYVAFTALATRALATEHRRRRYRLVQVATVPDFLVVAAAPLKLVGVPVLLDLHEDMPAFYRDRFRAPYLRPLVPLVEAVARGSATMADSVITVHEPLRRLAIDRGVPPRRIAVVMNGADERLFDQSRVTRRSFMEDGELRLIHHSSLLRIYGLDIAVQAVARVAAALPVRLDVYGDGPFRGEVEQLIAHHRLRERVRLHGRIPMHELPARLAGSDIGLVPSRPEPYLELSLSTKLLEYVAMCVPVIATDLATFRSHFSGDAIRYVAGGDPDALAAAIRELAADPASAARRADEARRQGSRYGWQVQAARYLDVVEGLVTREGEPAGL